MDEATGYGWRAFAGILIMIGGLLNVIDGLIAVINANRIQGVVNGHTTLPITNNVSTWGWVELVIGIVMVLAAFAIFAGATWGRVVGIFVAGLNLLVQFTYLGHYPFWSFTMILIDVLVIYGLVVHGRIEGAGTATTA